MPMPVAEPGQARGRTRIRLIRSVSVVVEVDIGSAEGGDRLNG